MIVALLFSSQLKVSCKICLCFVSGIAGLAQRVFQTSSPSGLLDFPVWFPYCIHFMFSKLWEVGKQRNCISCFLIIDFSCSGFEVDIYLQTIEDLNLEPMLRPKEIIYLFACFQLYEITVNKCLLKLSACKVHWCLGMQR